MGFTQTPTAIIGSAVAGAATQQAQRADFVRQELQVLHGMMQQNSLDMADLLLEAKTNNYYSQWGYPTFGEFVQESLEMKERKAFYLINIAERSKKIGVTRETMETIGVSKLKEIFSLDPAAFFHNIEENKKEPLNTHMLRLIGLAPTLSYEAVKAEVKRLKGIAPGDEGYWLNLFYSEEDKRDFVKDAFENARQVLGSKGRNSQGDPVEFTDADVLYHIIAELTSDPNFPASFFQAQQ